MIDQQVDIIHGQSGRGKQPLDILGFFPHPEIEHVHSVHPELIPVPAVAFSVINHLEVIRSSRMPESTHGDHHDIRSAAIGVQGENRLPITPFLDQGRCPRITEERLRFLVCIGRDLGHRLPHQQQDAVTALLGTES